MENPGPRQYTAFFEHLASQSASVPPRSRHLWLVEPTTMTWPAGAPALPQAEAASGYAETAQLIEAITDGLAHEMGLPAFATSYRIAKRALDILVSATGLVLLAPVFLIIAVLIRLDSPGPAFFIQERVGYRGRLFRMIKFRTMVDGAGVRRDGIHKRRDDGRITRVGRFLRKTSLDELPQLINVLLGQMSLVGPRPELPEIVHDRYQPWQFQRFLVPQGITGWWQVTGRGDKLLCEHTEDDLYYIEHASFWTDLKILAMTAQAVVRREGAF